MLSQLTGAEQVGEQRLLKKRNPMCLYFQEGLCCILPPLSCSLVQSIFKSGGMKED